MSRDNFKAKLRCPDCGLEGIAHLSQEDGYSFVFGNQRTELESLPGGFKFVETPDRASFDVLCKTCGVSAVTR